MTSFVIGRVVEPELGEITIKKDSSKRKIFKFGLLSGRTCTQFDIFEDSKIFSKVSNLKDGALVLAVVGTSVNDKGKLNCYLNSIGNCPNDLRIQLLGLVSDKQ